MTSNRGVFQGESSRRWRIRYRAAGNWSSAQVCGKRRHPETSVIWAHAGLGRVVQPPYYPYAFSESGDFIAETIPARPTRGDRLHHAS